MASIYDWSTTEANNATADSGINWQEGQPPSTVNNSARYMMRRAKEILNDLGAIATAGGTANAITVTASSPFSAYTKGIRLLFKASATNTGAATLNVNSVGTKAIVRLDGGTEVTLGAGAIVTGGLWEVVYDSALASGAGAWVLINPHDSFVQPIIDVASAATTNIGAAGTQNVRITGTTTITAFDNVAAGTMRFVRMAGALTLTYNATSLILPGGANITTAANDSFIALSLGSGNWQVLVYQKASISTINALPVQTASGTAVNFTGIPAGVRRVTVIFSGLSTNGANSLLVQIGGSAGTYETTGYQAYSSALPAGSPISGLTSSAGFPFFNNAAANTYNATLTLSLVDATTNTWNISGNGDLAGASTVVCGGGKSIASTLDKLRVTPIGGVDTFDAGKVSVSYEY